MVLEHKMEYDLYTTDDRRCGRVIQPDVGESSSGSSYAGSDASNAPGHSPADMVMVGKRLHSNQLSVEAEATMTGDSDTTVRATESGSGTAMTLRRSHDQLIHPYHGPTGSGLERGDDHISEIERYHSSSTVMGENTLTHPSARGTGWGHQAHEEPGDATNKAPQLSESGLGAGTSSHDNDTSSAPGSGRNPGSAMGFLDNKGSTSGRAVHNEEDAHGSLVEHLQRATILAGSDAFGRRSPPLERARSNSVQSNRNIREIILPRWQPDAEVTYCPICRTQFSFFVRKHHCRRCGRVVCNACSPHRITIPYQFIVQPPPAVAAPSAVSVTQPGPNMSGHVTGATSDFADRNGGMKVRLCNPCVPDPNPLPPQPQYSDMSGQVPTLYLNSGNRPHSFAEESTGGSGRVRGLSAASGLRPSDQRLQQTPTSPYNRQTGTITSNNGSNSLHPNVQTSHYPGLMHRADPLRVQGSSTSSNGHSSQSPSRALSSQSRGHANRHQSLSFIPGGSAPNPQPHYRSLLDIGSDQYTRTSSSNRPLPPVPHVNEEDECPVCHRVLFSRTLPDYENRRTVHIAQCIDEQIAFHSGSSSRPGAHTSQSQPAPTSYPAALSPAPSTAQQPPLLTPIANTPETRTAARERAHAAVVLGGATASSSAQSSSTPPAPRRTGMFIYRASEKDCVDDAECTICLEEFEVGASMARLECFCRFHRKCIQDWFVDHPGRCPVHQHDGYGF